jgi:hypothetical protein
MERITSRRRLRFEAQVKIDRVKYYGIHREHGHSQPGAEAMSRRHKRRVRRRAVVVRNRRQQQRRRQ